MKSFRKIAIYSLAVIGALAILLTSYELFMHSILGFEWEYHESNRILSPDGKYEAIITIANAGAMSSYRHGVHIVNKGNSFDPKDIVFSSKYLEPNEVKWVSDRELQIKHPPDRIWNYEAVWPYPY